VGIIKDVVFVFKKKNKKKKKRVGKGNRLPLPNPLCNSVRVWEGSVVALPPSFFFFFFFFGHSHLIGISLIPRLLPSFLCTVCNKKLGRSLGTRLIGMRRDQKLLQ